MLFSEFAQINPEVKLQKGRTYLFVEMEDIIPGKRYVSPVKKKVFNGGGAKFQDGDILFARITPCLENGKIAQVKGNGGDYFGSTEFLVFRAKEGISDNNFLFYLCYSDIIKKPAEKSMSGASGRQRASLETIKNIEIPEISLEKQQKIASILSAYDDLIENNTKRIKILEQMADAIYKEWFVKFRFPGYEKVRFVDSELGKIPEGWEIKKLSEIALIKGGKSLSDDKIFSKGRYPVFGGNGIQGYCDEAMYEGFVIAFGRVGAYCGSIHWSYDGAWLNNNASSIIPHTNPELLLGHLLNFDFTNLRMGSAQPFIPNSSLSNILMLLPSNVVINSFCEL